MVGAQQKSTGKVPTRSRPMSFQGTTPSPTSTALVACILGALCTGTGCWLVLGGPCAQAEDQLALVTFDKGGRRGTQVQGRREMSTFSRCSGTRGRDHTPSSSTSHPTPPPPPPHSSPPDPFSTGHPSSPLSPQIPPPSFTDPSPSGDPSLPSEPPSYPPFP